MQCAHGVCEDKARQVAVGRHPQAYISPASNRIKNEAATAKRFSNTKKSKCCLHNLSFANKGNTQVAYQPAQLWRGARMQISVIGLTINVPLCLQPMAVSVHHLAADDPGFPSINTTQTI